MRPAQTRNCSFRRFAQRRFQLAERHLDGVKVGRVLRQIAKRGAARFDRRADARSFVRSKIVDHDLILAFESWSQTIFNIRQKLGSVHWTIKSTRRSHAVSTERGDTLPPRGFAA